MNQRVALNRSKSLEKQIHYRCRLQYSKHGRLAWDKWNEYECLIVSTSTADGKQEYSLELKDLENMDFSKEKSIGLRNFTAVTCARGNSEKHDHKNVIILKIDGKRHRFGFDNFQDYNEWKIIVDRIFNRTINETDGNEGQGNVAINMIYESISAMKTTVEIADLNTEELLDLKNEPCELILDTDKIIIEQRGEKQYTFLRSKIHQVKMCDNDQIEFEMGSCAPVTGFIRFKFLTKLDAEDFYQRLIKDSILVRPRLESVSNQVPSFQPVNQTSSLDPAPPVPPRQYIKVARVEYALQPKPRLTVKSDSSKNDTSSGNF